MRASHYHLSLFRSCPIYAVYFFSLSFGITLYLQPSICRLSKEQLFADNIFFKVQKSSIVVRIYQDENQNVFAFIFEAHYIQFYRLVNGFVCFVTFQNIPANISTRFRLAFFQDPVNRAKINVTQIPK